MARLPTWQGSLGRALLGHSGKGTPRMKCKRTLPTLLMVPDVARKQTAFFQTKLSH